MSSTPFAYFLSVLEPLNAGGHCVHVLRVRGDFSMEWMKSHADEIAKLSLPHVTYNALLVEPAVGDTFFPHQPGA